MTNKAALQQLLLIMIHFHPSGQLKQYAAGLWDYTVFIHKKQNPRIQIIFPK
jgi:hypothetical protein